MIGVEVELPWLDLVLDVLAALDMLEVAFLTLEAVEEEAPEEEEHLCSILLMLQFTRKSEVNLAMNKLHDEGSKINTLSFISLGDSNISHYQIYHIKPSAIHYVFHYIPSTTMNFIIVSTSWKESCSHDLIYYTSKGRSLVTLPITNLLLGS